MAIDVAASPTLVEYRNDERERAENEQLDVASKKVRWMRGQLSVREAEVRHSHVGGCQAHSRLPGAVHAAAYYDPRDCDCDGPANARRVIQLAVFLLQQWSEGRRNDRLRMLPLIAALELSMGSYRERCWSCRGSGHPYGTVVGHCRTCAGTGTVPSRRIPSQDGISQEVSRRGGQ